MQRRHMRKKRKQQTNNGSWSRVMTQLWTFIRPFVGLDFVWRRWQSSSCFATRPRWAKRFHLSKNRIITSPTTRSGNNFLAAMGLDWATFSLPIIQSTAFSVPTSRAIASLQHLTRHSITFSKGLVKTFAKPLLCWQLHQVSSYKTLRVQGNTVTTSALRVDNPYAKCHQGQ